MEEKNVLLIDMYGVIIEESKGRLVEYAIDCLGEGNVQRIHRIIREEQCHTKAALGKLDADEFLLKHGFKNANESMKDYLENYLTIDKNFYEFAKKFSDKIDFVLLTNDIDKWSEYLTSFYDLNKYFKDKIVSGAVHLRKPNKDIFELALSRLNIEPSKCIFVDNSPSNILAAEQLGIKTVLFNRDKVNFHGDIVNDFNEMNIYLSSFVNLK